MSIMALIISLLLGMGIILFLWFMFSLLGKMDQGHSVLKDIKNTNKKTLDTQISIITELRTNNTLTETHLNFTKEKTELLHSLVTKKLDELQQKLVVIESDIKVLNKQDHLRNSELAKMYKKDK